jgi:hypothetical protein
MSTPAERRERKQRRRSAGWALIGVATIATLVGIFALFIQTQVTVVGGGGIYFCGGVIDGFSLSGVGGAICAEALSGYLMAVVMAGVVALAGFVAGGIVLARTR